MKVRIDLYRLCFDRISVRYKVYTPGDNAVKRRACFVSSPLGDAECWDALCRILASQGCLCVAFELPGFGHTPVNAPQDNATRASILWGVLDEVEYSRGDPQSRWHLISHGSGCGVILEMARTQKESVVSRTLISPVTHRFESGLSRKFAAGRFGRWLYSKAYAYSVENINRFSAKVAKLYGEEPDQVRMDLLHREFCREGRLDCLFRLFENGYRLSPKAYTIEDRIMLIWGKRDPFGASPEEKLMRVLRDVEVHYISNTAHMPMETMPQETSEYLNGWFEYMEGHAKGPTRKKV